jgi:hypothetical protein
MNPFKKKPKELPMPKTEAKPEAKPDPVWDEGKRREYEQAKKAFEAEDANRLAWEEKHKKPLTDWLAPDAQWDALGLLGGFSVSSHFLAIREGQKKAVEALLKDPVRALRLLKPFADIEGWEIK